MTTPEIVYTPTIKHDSHHVNRELAAAVLNACKLTWDVPDDIISASVTNGWVLLEGEFEWFYQREAAGNAVKHINGIKGVHNHITIKSRPPEAADQRI